MPVLSAAPSPTPVAAPALPERPRPTPRLVARRAGKAVAVCALGYLALWLVTVLGTLGVSFLAQQQYSSGERVGGVNHFLQVDDKLWRGSAPGPEGYEELAERGVRTVIDLRAEDLSEHQLSLPGEAGLDLISMPIRDGQTPTGEQVDQFLAAVESAPGPVFVHCGAGVGRTGAVTAAYLVATEQADAGEATLRNRAGGPPSLEQIYYALPADPGEADQPPLAVQAVSRLMDAPRRINASLSIF
ncbi:fused DSP-PTPase phosphatase/NAD kinase-like protein [Streptomyces specialis]|uniref:fused DSP-PTPase phosphatase/NAD kinase-like protein n=1 Tax=Streptomyces specialis TaxID=498367 RepID=UPI00073EA34D|nr:dual specificity protein phosphatase family protein [Streptomyces specialis]